MPDNMIFQWMDWLKNHQSERNKLRRCKNIENVLMQPAFYKFLDIIKVDSENRSKYKNYYALTASIFASLVYDKSEQKEFAEKLKKRDVNERRFVKLIETNTPIEAYPIIKQLLRFIDNRVNLNSFYYDLYYFGDKTKQKWAEQFFIK